MMNGGSPIMKTLYLLIILLTLAASALGQSDLDKMVATERAFAQMAADAGTKSAFLKFMAPDAVVFEPDKVSANIVWSKREESADKLSWAPNYADISSNDIGAHFI